MALKEAYADRPLYTRHDGTGTSISAASQPTIVAMMLERVQVQPGQRVLELGAGTGYNAGPLAHQAGSDGSPGPRWAVSGGRRSTRRESGDFVE
ncbi:hypothetical protein [Pseudonocardia kunmingensis]|uniref:hypothetical protein n=1 Tax=Pseudonocardia kunmingensis TaxID=630975 RepID=UPI001FE354DE|nr:hypothetical protein [Pseudonocardia kunmingensis]